MYSSVLHPHTRVDAAPARQATATNTQWHAVVRHNETSISRGERRALLYLLPAFRLAGDKPLQQSVSLPRRRRLLELDPHFLSQGRDLRAHRGRAFCLALRGSRVALPKRGDGTGTGTGTGGQYFSHLFLIVTYDAKNLVQA